MTPRAAASVHSAPRWPYSRRTTLTLSLRLSLRLSLSLTLNPDPNPDPNPTPTPNPNPNQVAILTPYNAQIRELERACRRRASPSLAISNVDTYQVTP